MTAVTAINKPRRDGRNSAKRLVAAQREIEIHAERQRSLRVYRADENARYVIKLLELATDLYVETNFRIRPSDRVTTFLDISMEELAKPEFKAKVRAWYELIWTTENLDNHTHKKCKAYLFEHMYMPTYANLKVRNSPTYNGCICCSRKLGCEHSNNQALSQAACRERGIYHGGRCYHVVECLDCGDISATDSSD